METKNFPSRNKRRAERSDELVFRNTHSNVKGLEASEPVSF